MTRDGDDIGLAETRATGSDEEAPAADRATVQPAGGPSAARPATRLATVDRGRYHVDGEMARGGLGRILRARDLHLERTVALKEMLGGGAEAERRFVREALITARLEHPSIVPVHDAGSDETGAPFYAMKLVGGTPLTEVIAAAQTTAARLALVPRILAVADAIAYAHSERVIHRDLKPGNVLVGEFGETVVIDWGLAKDLSISLPPDRGGDTPHALASLARPHPSPPAPAESETLDGSVLGTPAYMAPEQAAGGEVDERADVYAIGAMLYELLAGTPPHRGKTLEEVLRQVIAGDLEPLHQRAPDVPRDLAAIVAQAMAREPAERYPSARELAEDLRRYVTGQLVGVYEYGWRERVRRFVARNKAAVAVGLIGLGILAVVGTLALLRIIDERDQARAARAIAETKEREARAAEQAARVRGDELLIEQARALLGDDPTRAIAILAGLPADSTRWSAARIVAADARARGIGDVLPGHAAATEAVAVDGDGDRIATVAHDGIRVWDLTARTVQVIPLPAPCGGQGDDDCVFGAWQLALSGDGRRLAATAGAVHVWDLEAAAAAPTVIQGDRAWMLDDGRVVVRVLDSSAPAKSRIDVVDPTDGKATPVFTGWAEHWLVSPGGTVVAILPEELRIWRAGEPRVAVRAGPVRSDAVAVSASGRLIAWAEAEARVGTASAPKYDTTLWVWRQGDKAPTGYPITWPHDLAISRDDTAVIWRRDDEVHWLYLEPALDLRSQVESVAGTATELACGPGRDVAIVAGGRGVGLVREGNAGQSLLEEPRDWRPAVSGDGTRIALAGAALVRTWSVGPAPYAVATPPTVATPPRARGDAAALPRMVITPELVGSADGTTFVIDWTTHPVEVWRRTGGALARTGTLPIDNHADLSVSPDGKHVLYVDDDGAGIVPTGGGEARRLDAAELGWFGPDGTPYTVGEGQVIRRWNVDGTGGERVCPATDAWSAVRVSPDGSTIADLTGGTLRRCRLAGSVTDEVAGVGELEQWTLLDDGGRVAGWDRALASIVVAGDPGGARRAVPITGAPIGVRISPDGRWVIGIAAEGGFTIGSVADGAVRSVAFSSAMSNEVAFLPGDVVAVAAQDAIVVADLATGVHRVLPLGRTPGAIAGYRDGALAVTRSGELRIYLDDLPHDPAALRVWLADATTARIGAAGELVTAEPFTVK